MAKTKAAGDTRNVKAKPTSKTPVSREELRAAMNELARALEQKEPVLAALEASAHAQPNQVLTKALMEIRRAVRAGTSIGDAMARLPDVFPATLRQTVRDGESSGDVAARLRAWAQSEQAGADAEQELLTLDQAVQFLGTSKPTLYRLLAQGELNGLKVGRQWRFRKADLVAHMERKPATVAVSATADIDAEIAFFEAEAEKAGITLRREESDYSSSEGKVSLIINSILGLALKGGCSDIHIEPMRGDFMVRFRNDGVLRVLRRMPSSLLMPIVGRLKVMADLDVMERRLPQDGRIHLKFEEQDFDVRISFCPTIYGESIVMRILFMQNSLVPLDNLDLAPDHRAQIEELMNWPNGLIAFTGPVGSGKTTMLYSCLNLKMSEKVKVITIEDTYEFALPHANQISLNPKAGLTYPVALRSVLRQDPDIIMVGEIPDAEVAGLSIHAALTGHLVVTSMHAEDATSFLTRFIGLGIEPFLISAAVVAVVSQRLARRICSNCKEEYSPPRELLLRFGHDPELHPEVKFWRGRGCEKCRRTGYRGRVAIFEILRVNEEIADMILRRAAHAELKEAARANGMRTIAEDGFGKCIEGVTNPEEIMRVVFAQV